MTVTPIKTPDPLATVFDQIRITVKTYQHAPVFTVAEGTEIKAQIAGGHTKNLFLKDKKGGLWLVVALGDTRVDMNWLSKRLNAPRFSFGKPDLLLNVLGVTPGSVTPFALINDTDRKVQVVLDQAMMEQELVNYHPLENDKTTTLTPQDLSVFLDHLGYTPQVIDFTR